MKAFPPADSGMVRFVLNPPKQEKEFEYKLQLIVGKTVATDRANRYFFGGQIEEETIDGWGFPKFIVRELGPMAGTLMAVDPDAPQLERFITLGGDPFFIRYNSALPVVVYVPTGVEVRYRIWKAADETHTMEPG
jgi:ecotin